MNSYPPELLAQLAPVMFVAGLDAAPVLPPESPLSPSKPQDAFSVLMTRLRDALSSQRKVAVWQPEKAKTFHVILVDREVRFPPRKLYPTEDQPNQTAHSPLSPLTPSSPLYPDGLIAPIWIRKHTTLVPSVFVLFTRLFEAPPSSHGIRSPLEAPTHDVARENEERKRDAELAAEVALRKKSTNERGMKLTVVLIASRRMLDDPALDARLTFIRRQSGLDSRAALFVLSPVSSSELDDFVRSLQEALYEPALDYYTAHSKRVRRKRNRHAQSGPSYPVALPSTPATASVVRPLRPEGWNVRYEFKMACFAEFRGEDEVALKHYQDAYASLVIMFGSTSILPPRTKRWAEAKVLIDAISIKVCKLYLYNNEHALALGCHNAHVRRFCDFSRGWGIGEDTFEFWSWVARQYRVLSELLEQGTRSTLTIPTHVPAVPIAGSAAAATALGSTVALAPPAGARGVLEGDAMRALGLNPSVALQHPGFYYYMSARCTERRRQRFLTAVEAEANGRSAAAAPGFANEKKVDHLTIILELYTRAYELFKKHAPEGKHAQGRLTLWIAYRIAHTYHAAGKFDMAVRFFERIAKTYRRERWGTMLRPLLTTWYACAQQLGDVELSVRLLIEMLGHGYGAADDPGAIAEDLAAVLSSTVPSSPDGHLTIDLSESEPIFDTTAIFWKPEVEVGEVAAFQISITLPDSVSLGAVPFTSLAVFFSDSDSDPPLIVHHAGDAATPGRPVQLVNIGDVSHGDMNVSETSANLRWAAGSTLVLAGRTVSNEPAMLKVHKLVFTLKQGAWSIEIPQEPCSTREGTSPNPRWLSSLDPVQFIPVQRREYSITTVRYPPHQLDVSLSHYAPAYLNEEYPIVITISNTDTRDLNVAVDVLLQPTEIDDGVNHMRIHDETSSGLIKGISFGTLRPGVSVQKTLYLVSTGGAGDRVLDISVQSRSTASPALLLSPATPTPGSPPLAGSVADTSESLHTLVVSTVAPVRFAYEVAYRRTLKESPGFSDLNTFDADYWDDADGGEGVIKSVFECVGPWGVKVESLALARQHGDFAHVIDSFLDDDDENFPSEWLPRDRFSDVCRITIAPEEEHDYAERPIAGPGEYSIAWRKILPNGSFGVLSHSRFALPSLQPPLDGLVALLHAPSTAHLHQSTPLRLVIRNRHPSRSANITVQVDCESSDGFVLAGLRSGRVPVLVPGAEHTLVWSIIPIECGFVRLPRIHVFDRRRAFVSGTQPEVAEDEDDIVKVVDVRFDARNEGGAEAAVRRDSLDSVDTEHEGGERPVIGTVLVLP